MKKSTEVRLGVDSNGYPTEEFTTGDQTIVVHYDDVPESDITVIRGMRCTTAIRTVIDIAVDLQPDELETVMNDCLDRRLFTVREMRSRLSKPDMTGRRGADLVRSHLDNRHSPRQN